MKPARALSWRASLSSRSLAFVGILALCSFWVNHAFAGDTAFAALQKTSSTEEAESVLGRKVGHRQSQVDRFIDGLTPADINQLTDPALLALLRRSSLGVSLRIGFLLPQDTESRRRSSEMGAQAELYKVGRALRRGHGFEHPAVVAGGLSVAAFALWSHFVGMPNLERVNPEHAQLVLKAMVGTIVGLPTAFLAMFRSTVIRKYRRHATLLNITTIAMRELVQSGALITERTEQTIADTFEEIAMRCYPKRTLENNHPVSHHTGDYFNPLPLKERIDQVFSIYAQYIKLGKFETEKVARHARRSADRIIEALKMGLRIPGLDYTKPERDILSDAINALDPPTSLAEVLQYVGKSEPGGGTTYASDSYENQDDSPYRESARYVEDEELPVVHLEMREPKSGSLFEASFSRRTIRGEENQMHFALNSDLYRSLSNKTTQKDFLPAVEKELPASAGTWIRYTDLGKSEFTYVAEENFPKQVPFEFVGSVELWARPWADGKPYAVFSGATGEFLSGETLRAVWQKKNPAGRVNLGGTCARGVQRLAMRSWLGKFWTERNEDNEG